MSTGFFYDPSKISAQPLSTCFPGAVVLREGSQVQGMGNQVFEKLGPVREYDKV